MAISWPKEYGGGGLSVIEQAVLAEEFSRGGAPERDENDMFGIDLLGNTLIALGTEEQKKHFLPRILSGEDRWCQGFSEPEAGSDLASVRTKAVLDGDEWIINGQKIWTSAGPTANWIFVLARTDPEVPKHKGLSMLLVPVDQPGVVVRPIVNAAGHASFSEVFFTDARARAIDVLGGIGGGWATAMTVLGFERGSQITTAAIEFGRGLDWLRQLARERGRHTDPLVRDELAWCYSRVQILRYQGYRGLTALLNGQRPGAEAAINKVIWSEYFRRYTDLAVEILGIDALHADGPGNGGALIIPVPGTPNSAACWLDELLYATGRHHLRGQLTDPAQRDRRTAARTSEGAALTWIFGTTPSNWTFAIRCAPSWPRPPRCRGSATSPAHTATMIGCGNDSVANWNYLGWRSRRSTAG